MIKSQVKKPETVLLEVTFEGASVICAALEAVSPTGGGSTTYHLMRDLRKQALPMKIGGLGTDPSDDRYHKLVGNLQKHAHKEYMEAFELKTIPRTSIIHFSKGK